MPIEIDVDRNIQLYQLSKKYEIECDKCNKMYKNVNSLRMHKCKIIDKTDEIIEKMSERLDRLEEENKTLKEKLEKGNIKSIKNITNNTNNTDKSCFSKQPLG